MGSTASGSPGIWLKPRADGLWENLVLPARAGPEGGSWPGQSTADHIGEDLKLPPQQLQHEAGGPHTEARPPLTQQ